MDRQEQRRPVVQQVSICWQPVDVDVAVGSRIAPQVRYNVTPDNRLLVQFGDRRQAYCLDLRHLVRELIAARTVEHDPPKTDPPPTTKRPPPRLRPLVGLILALACGLLAGCLSASWIFGVASVPAANHKHSCKPVIGYSVQFCTTCQEPCLTLGPAFRRRFA